MIQGAATTRQQRRRAEKYAQLSFDPSRLEQIMLLTEENNKLKSKLEETQEHFSKATGLPLEGYQLRQRCINLEKQFQASQNQLMESESMRIADRNYISELVQNIQSLQSELEIAKTSDWKRVDVIADEKDTLFNDILIKLRHYKCEIFGLQAAFNEFSGWKGKIKTIHGKTDGLTSSISHLEAKLRDLVKEGDDMSVSKQNDTMVYVPLSELSDIKERNLGLEFEIKDLTTKNDENERLIQELRKKLENSHREEECKSFKSTIEELQTSEAALLKEVYELKETRSMCNEKINSLSQNIEKAEREKMSAEKISEELKQINQQLQIVSSLRDSNQKQKEVNIQESHLQKTICLQGQQIKQDDLEGRNEIHQSLNEKNKLKEDSQSSELQLKLDQLKVKLENKQEQYKKLHKDVRSFVETVSDNAGILLNKKEPVSNQLSTALENIKVYINNTSEGLVSRRNLHKKLTAKAAALRKAEQELESSNKVIDELRIQLEEMKQRHNTELMELELASQEEITKYINEISQLKDAIKTAEYELEYLKSPDFEPDKELPKKVEELTQELLISKEKQKQLQRINDKQQNECEELRKQISQLSADDGKSGSEGKFEEIFLKAKPLKPKRVKAPLKENGGDNEVLSPGKKAPKYHAGIQETSKNEEIFTDPWSSDSDDDVQKSFCNEIYPKEDSCSKIPKKLGPEVVKMDTSPRKTEKEKEFISSEKTSPGEFLDSWLKEFSWSDDIIDDRLLPGSDGGYRNETSPKEAKSTKSTNELGAEAKKMDTSPRKTEKDIELFLPGRWSPKNQAKTSETSKISEQSPPSRFNPKQRQTVLPPVRSRHTGLSQNVLPVPTDEFENSFGNENSSRAQKYTKSTNELGAEAKKKDTSPMKTEKEKEFISSVKKSPKGRAMAEVLDSLLEEFGCSDDIIEDRLLPGSDGGYRNETSPKEAKSTKSTNELGAEAKKMDTSLRKTEKDIELFLPGRWSPKNQATTSETSKISEQSPPSRFNPKQRQTVLPPVRSRHTGLSQNVLPVPTDEFENSFGNENSSRAHTYIKSTNELGAEAKKMDTSPMKTEKETEVISSENMSDDEFLDLWLKEFGWSDDIIDDRLLPGSDGGYRNETSPKEAKSTKSTNELGAEAKKMDTSPMKTEKDIELSLPGRWSPKNQATTSETSKISEQSPPSRFNPKQRQTVLPPVRSRHTGLSQNVLPVPTDEFENSFGNEKSSRAQKYTKSTNELGAEAKKMDTSPRKTEKDIELSLPGRWSPKNQVETSENSKISEQSPPSRFNPKQRQTVLPPVRSRHTGLPQNVLPVPTDEFENSFGNVKSSRAQKYTKSTNELGAEAKKMDTSPMKTEKEKEFISSVKKSPKGRAMAEVLDSLLEEFGCSDDIIEDRLLPGSDGGYRNETSPKEAKSTKSTNELGAEAKKTDTSPRKTEKDIELFLPGRWSPKNQAKTSETSKISEQSPPSRFNPKQRQTVLPPVRSRHTGLSQNVLPVPTDEFENSFGNENSSRAHTYIKSTNELGAEAKKMDTSPMKTEKEKEVISSENMSDDEFLDLWLKEFGWSDDIIDDRLLPGSDGGYRNETSPKEAKSTKSTNELGAEAKKMDTSPMKTEKDIELSLPGRWSPKNQVETSENSKISEQSPPSRFNPKQRQTVLPPVRSRHTGLPQNVLPVPTDEFENSFGNVKSSRAQKYTKSTNELGAEAKKMDTSPMKTEKEKEFISSVKKSPKGRAMAEVLDSLLEEFGCSDDIIEDRLLPGSDGGYRNETSPKEAKSTKSTNELGAEAKKTDTSPRKTEKDIELFLPGRWSPKNQATTSETSKISEQSPPSRFNPKQRQTVLPPVRSRHTGLSQNVLPVPTDEFENSFGNENSSRAHTYIKSTNELGAEAKKMDNSPMKTEKEKEVISSENMSPGEFLDLWLKEFGWSDDIIDDRLLPGSNGGYRNETSPKEAKSTKSTNELGAEAKKMDTSPRKTEKDIELSLPGRWSPKNQAETSENSKISEQSPPSRFNPKQRQTVLPPVRSRHTGLPQNVLPVPTDEFENSFGNEKSSRAQKYTKSTNELGAEAKKKDTSPRKTEKEKELISSENMSHDEFLDSLLEEFGWSDDIIEDRLLTGSDGGYRNETSPKEAKSTKSRNELGAEAKKMDTSPKKIGKEKELISSLKKVEAGSEDVEKKKKVTFLLERHSR
ncbi:interaptin-like [Nothobranchius furzeri]|uniref:interaptin-like n=1 Tax=Nothobranchius furzeri TaxID=105023 RepID=UPI00390481BE